MPDWVSPEAVQPNGLYLWHRADCWSFAPALLQLPACRGPGSPNVEVAALMVMLVQGQAIDGY